MSSRTRELLDQVVSDLDRALGDDALAGVTDEERIAIIAAAGAVMRRAEAVVVEALATGDAVDLPHLAGCRSQNELLQRALAVESSAATRFGRVVDLVRRDVNLLSGERMPARWPALRDALLAGRVGIAGMLAATAPVEKAWERLTVDERAGADECLAEAARAGASGADIETGAEADESTGELTGTDGPAGAAGPVPTPDDLAYLAHTIVAVLDPDGAEPDDRNAQHRRGITLGRLRDGLRSIRGWLSPEVAAQLEAVMDAVNNPAGERSASRVAFVPSERSDGAEADDPDLSGSDPLDSDPFDSDPFNSDSRAVIDGDAEASRCVRCRARHRRAPPRHADPGRCGADTRRHRRRAGSRSGRGMGEPARCPRRSAWSGAGQGRRAGGVLRNDPARHDARGADRRHRQHRQGVHRASATRDRRSRQGMPHSGMPCPGSLVRDPSRHRACPRRTDDHRQRSAAVLVASQIA